LENWEQPTNFETRKVPFRRGKKVAFRAFGAEKKSGAAAREKKKLRSAPSARGAPCVPRLQRDPKKKGKSLSAAFLWKMATVQLQGERPTGALEAPTAPAGPPEAETARRMGEKFCADNRGTRLFSRTKGMDEKQAGGG
jgi:hypothetical protein